MENEKKEINKELYREEINQKITGITFENGIEFIKEDGNKITLEAEHNQDCCENVYADFEIAKDYTKEVIGKEFKEMIIKSVEEMGFLICLYQDYDKGEKIFIPCYNEQNGYYGDDLELIINGTTKIDISNLVEDHID